jgi:hypothetical protein
VKEYYQLAREFQVLSRQPLAEALRQFHQESVAAAIERAADIVHEGLQDATPWPEIEAAVRSIELSGKQVADKVTHLRHAEAVLYVLRSRKTLIVPRGDVALAFGAGHGVDLVRNNPTMVEVVLQPGKFLGA